MNDTWMNNQEWKNRAIAKTLNGAALRERVQVMDQEIMTAHLRMARKMVEGGSYAALSVWMKSDDEDAVVFREWVNTSGHRATINLLYAGLRDRNIEELKTTLNER